MDRNEFRLFLKRYAENKCTPEEMALIDHWYELIGDDEVLSAMPESEWEATEDRLWQKISQGTQARPRIRPMRWAMAAAIAGVLIGGTIWFTFLNRTPEDAVYAAAGGGQYQEIRNTSDMTKQCRLEDGTMITLYPGAAMKYPHHFNTTKREVYLKGRAFFDVGKDANRPFYVYSHHLVTHVLGTSFMIQPARHGGQVEVSVRTGKVEVYEQGQSKHTAVSAGVILTPNQKVLYRQAESSFETTLVDKPEPIVAPDQAQSLVFSDDPLHKVVDALENYYGVEIVVEKEALYNCPFTGALTQRDLYTRLDVVCQSIGATYEIIGTRILIRGKGCN